METTTQELLARIERLEQTVSREATHHDPPGRISLAGWLRISGPTFAVMLFGFTLVWQSLESTRGQLLELTRTTGRLEGTLGRMESTLDRLDGTLADLRLEVRGLGERADPPRD